MAQELVHNDNIQNGYANRICATYKRGGDVIADVSLTISKIAPFLKTFFVNGF